MPLDPYIARGVPSFMQDVPNTLSQLRGDRMEQQRTNELARRTDIMGRDDERAAMDEQKKQKMLEKLGEMRGFAKSPQTKAQYLEMQKAQHPDFSRMPELQLPPDQAFDAIVAKMETILGMESKQAPGPEYRTVGDSLLELPTAPGGQPRVAYTAPQKSAAGPAAPKPAKAPEGYRFSDDGESLYPIPGGPKDPTTAAPISAKDRNTARVKLTQVRVARKQLNDAKEKYAALKDTFSAGPGGKYIPTPSGRAYDAAINSMRSSISALTRVPGVGAMSDYETRLDQAKFPDRGNYEEVGQQQLQALEDMLNTIEQSYSELLGGGAPSAPAAPEAPKRRKFNPQTGKIE